MELNVITKAFSELTTIELYDILHLRNQVFIVEQNCPYLDVDQKDKDCFHMLMYNGDQLAGYSRILPAGLSYDEVSFGRVLISPEFRGKGLGRKIVEETVKACQAVFGNVAIKIGAQLYLLNFYNSFGFEADGEEYDEDGIMHIDMVKPSIDV